MKSINPYLNFNGTTEEAFNFYRSVFGGEFLMLKRFKDMPDGDNVPANAREKIMHIVLPMGKENILMANDALEFMGHPLTVGNNFYITISPESREEADKIFNGLSAGGKIEMPMADMFWGDRCGTLVDPDGYTWMIGTHKAEPSAKEMKKKMLEQIEQMKQQSASTATAA